MLPHPSGILLSWKHDHSALENARLTATRFTIRLAAIQVVSDAIGSSSLWYGCSQDMATSEIWRDPSSTSILPPLTNIQSGYILQIVTISKVSFFFFFSFFLFFFFSDSGATLTPTTLLAYIECTVISVKLQMAISISLGVVPSSGILQFSYPLLTLTEFSWVYVH